MSTSQKGQAGKNLIQVGRDYVRYIQINIAAENWFIVIINFISIGLIFYLLGSGTKWIVNVIREPYIITTSTPTPTVMPTSTPTVTPTSTPTVTPIPTPTVTPIPIPTVTPIPIPTVTPIPIFTPTPIPIPTPTPIPVPTPTPIPIFTPEKTKLLFKGSKSLVIFDGLQIIVEKVEQDYSQLRIDLKAKNNTKGDIYILNFDYYIHDNVDTTYKKAAFPFDDNYELPALSTIAGSMSFSPNPKASTITLIVNRNSQKYSINIPIK